MKVARFKALIFDMDGTLTRPTLDFHAIRAEIGIASGDLASEIAKLSPRGQKKAWAIVEAHEERAMAAQELQEGALDILSRCRTATIRVGLVTRNLRKSVDHLCRRYSLRFDAVITREFPFLKPHPAPILHMLEGWRMLPQDALTVGDYLHDIDSGRAAGTSTCFFQNPGQPFYGQNADFVVASMLELDRLVFGDTQSAASSQALP
jgi:HAD superfamily hydrolase (TIGR01549 family)